MYMWNRIIFCFIKFVFIIVTFIGSLMIKLIQMDYFVASHFVKEVKLEVIYLYCLEVIILVLRKKLSF